VEAGAAVTGSLLNPKARLVSRPPVPDSDKLSWLVLGHGIEGASAAEFDLLTTAAGTLLSAGESVSLQASLAAATGLDEVRLGGTGELEGSVLTLGKRVSSRAYLSYEQGLTGVSNLVKLNYSLGKRWSVQTEAGGTGAGAVDLLYTLEFD
jgi:translocation and assembly module TamB